MGARATTGDRDEGTEDGPLRLCAVSRTQEPIERLVRFVLGPDGTIVPDLARQLPGRGVWVERHPANRAGCSAAQGLRPQPAAAGFAARGLAGPHRAADGQAARRAPSASPTRRELLVSGFSRVEELIARGQAAVLIHAADGSRRRQGQARPKIQRLTGCRAGCGGNRERIDRARIGFGHGPVKCGTCCSDRKRRQPTNSAGGRPPSAVPGGGACREGDLTQDVHDRNERND